MRRRALLSALTAAGTAASVAGCLGGTDAGSPPANDAPPTDSATRDATTDTAHPRSDSPSGPVRCRGDPVSVERTLSDPPGYGDDVEYYPDNGTVRFVSIRSGDEAVRFDEMSFDRWASMQCAEAGLERVRSATADRLGTDEFGSGVGQSPGFLPSNSLVVRLDVATRVGDGETAAPPAVSLSRLADVAPRSVDATVTLEGDAFSRTVPVFAEHVEVGLT